MRIAKAEAIKNWGLSNPVGPGVESNFLSTEATRLKSSVHPPTSFKQLNATIQTTSYNNVPCKESAYIIAFNPPNSE